MTRFETTLRGDATGALLEVRGDVDLVSADELVAAAGSVIDGGSCRLDLSGVTFIDSTGVSALISIRDDALRNGSNLEFVAVSRHVVRTLELTGLSETFGVHGDVVG